MILIPEYTPEYYRKIRLGATSTFPSVTVQHVISHCCTDSLLTWRHFKLAQFTLRDRHDVITFLSSLILALASGFQDML